jgi:hypothetical protein
LHYHPWRAKAALHGALLHERLLHRMETLCWGDTLDGYDVGILRLARPNQAGIHRTTIQKDGTGAAFAGTATFFGTGEVQVVPDDIEQPAVGRGL